MRDAEVAERNMHHGLVWTVRANSGYQQLVAGRGSTIEQDLLVLGVEERHVPIELQRSILTADPVEEGDVRLEIAGGTPIPDPDLELIGIWNSSALQVKRSLFC